MPENPPDTVINHPELGRVVIPYDVHFGIATEIRAQRVLLRSCGTEPAACMEDAAGIVMAAARAGYELTARQACALADARCTACGKPAGTITCGRGGCPLGADL